MRRLIIVFSVLGVITAHAAWAADITGLVDDGTNPISGAVVQAWDGTTKAAESTTDESGQYTLSGLSEGSAYDIRAYATDYYGNGGNVWKNVLAPSSDVNFSLVPLPTATPTNTNCNFWSNLNTTTFDGAAVQPGLDVIVAKDPSGVVCGVYVVEYDGANNVTVYGDDPTTEDVDEGASDGDIIQFLINGYPATVVSGSAEWNPNTTKECALSATVPVLVSIAVTPETAEVEEGLTVSFTATGTYSDESTADVTAEATWTSSDEAVGTVEAGVFTAVGAGQATVTAGIGEISGEATVTVTLRLVSIRVTPSPLDSIVVDTLRTPHVPSTLQYTATGTYWDGSTSNLTSQAVWTSSDPTVATVVAGLASSVGPGGPVWIKAAVGGIADSTQLKVAALGDVQCDGDVGGEDGRLVVKIIVQKDPYDVPERPTVFEFDAADFMPEYPPTGDAINVFDVVGIIRHMLDPTWVPPPSWPGSKPVFDEKVLLMVAKAVVREDGEVRIPIEITTYRPMAAAELRLRYNPGTLSLVAPQLTDRTQRMSISYGASEDGELRVVLYSLTGDEIPAGSGSVLHVVFDTRGTEPAQLKVEEVLLADKMGRSVPVRTTAVESEAVHAMPTVYALSQNVPNPFNARTTIAFHLPVQGEVHLSIYSLDGQRICSLVDEVRYAGSYSMVWDGKDEAGRAVASGVYFYRLRVGDFVRTKRMVLLK